MLSQIPAAAGRLLISEPFMPDPNFKRSVIILTEYSPAGAMGFILNHQTDYMLGDILPDVSYSEIPVYMGGPVAENTLHYIHRCPDKIEGGIEIAEGVFWGGDFDKIKELITNYQLTEDEIKFFTGYSGWTPDQLDNELREDAWIVTNKFEADAVFANNEHNLWKETVISLGQRYAHIANFPENPTLN
ncbi:YqgE/AlgH family protein [Mucilaginibacter sp.]|uniref:YqgE/AlgH family protein n=1 Tax=Mucilaginibacter sp. TaxID=1882438 RepID=UPI0032658D6C